MGISQLLSDPAGFITSLLPLIPAILPALILHEVAHGYVAYRLGDPTAKSMERLSLNPLKHLDPLGTLCMLLFDLGWAKPVPVDPRYFRHPRRDDFLVSIAGVTANFIMFLFGCVLMYSMTGIALNVVPDTQWIGSNKFMTTIDDTVYLISKPDVWLNAYSLQSILIEPYLGKAWGFVYEVIVNFTFVNISLAIFNLLPVPPLDGYHVVNDLLFKRPLFAPHLASQVGRVILLVLVYTDWLSDGLLWVMERVFSVTGQIALTLFG